jgi:cephalosporin-C deacetylase-like acetyl esterase
MNLLIGMSYPGAGAQQQVAAPLAGAPTYEQAMDRFAQPFLDRRRAAIEKIQTKEQALARQAQVRATLLRLLGGLPGNHDALNEQVVGTVPGDGFRVERLIYDSLPGYHVTANLYLPENGKGPFPAVIYHAGHAPFGKTEAYGLGANLARDGIAVLAYDPLGAGERLQAMNPATGKSWAGPDEHSQAEIPISLIGDHVARYMVWDAMRGIDYLSSRPDIDANNIGSFGCSGGGTLSAYLTALDDRVKAGVVACYLTSYKELLKGIGPQDGEQVIPGQIREGLDFADWVELAAPRAYAMVATTEDMFPFAGAKAAHDEAARFYKLLGAGENLQWFTGPGTHGMIFPLIPQIVGFFNHWLLHSDSPAPALVAFPFKPHPELQCTSTGQVTTGLTGRTIYQVNRERARSLVPAERAITTQGDLEQLQSRLKVEIPAVTGMESMATALPQVDIAGKEERGNVEIETIVFHSRSGMALPGRLALPKAGGRKTALLITSERPMDALTGQGSEFDKAAQAGNVVLAMTPLPWPPSTDKPRPTMGTMLPWTARALLDGKTFVGMRAEDMIAAVAWLAAQDGVDAAKIGAYADGASGVALLHAAVLEPRIGEITIERTLSSYASVVDANVHRDVAETVIPGVLLHYDLDDLMIAIAPRAVLVVSPVSGSWNVLPYASFRDAFARVFRADESLGLKGRITYSAGKDGEFREQGDAGAARQRW